MFSEIDQSSLVVLDTCLTQIEDTELATVAGAHARLELRIIILTTVSFIVSHTNPRFLYILIELELVLRVHMYSYCVVRSHIGLVIGNAWYDCLSLNFSIGIFNDGSLNGGFSDTDRLTRLRLGTSSHV